MIYCVYILFMYFALLYENAPYTHLAIYQDRHV